MNVVDSHLHVNMNGFSLRDIIKYLDRERIDGCWLLSWEEVNPGLWPYHSLPVEEIYEAYVKYPTRIIPFYAPDPAREDAVVQLEKWHKKGIRGCGELKSTQNWESDKIRLILEACRKLKIPVVFHMEESENRVTPRSNTKLDQILFSAMVTEKTMYQIPRYILRLLAKGIKPLKDAVKTYRFPGYLLDFTSLESVLKDFPDVKFIAHGPMFWKHISSDGIARREMIPKGPLIGEGIIWHLLRNYPNLYADISAESGLNALTRDPGNAKRFLALFENKILYGTDNVLKGQKEFLDSLKLLKRAYKNIYGENACRIIGRNNV